jgi:hypothetical protein
MAVNFENGGNLRLTATDTGLYPTNAPLVAGTPIGPRAPIPPELLRQLGPLGGLLPQIVSPPSQQPPGRGRTAYGQEPAAEEEEEDYGGGGAPCSTTLSVRHNPPAVIHLPTSSCSTAPKTHQPDQHREAVTHSQV